MGWRACRDQNARSLPKPGGSLGMSVAILDLDFKAYFPLDGDNSEWLYAQQLTHYKLSDPNVVGRPDARLLLRKALQNLQITVFLSTQTLSVGQLLGLFRLTNEYSFIESGRISDYSAPGVFKTLDWRTMSCVGTVSAKAEGFVQYSSDTGRSMA